MPQFTPSILQHRKNLQRRFDQLLQLKNVDTQTLERDAQYSIFRLAQLVAKEFPSAEQEYPWTTEHLSYRLPADWQPDLDPVWQISCPTLIASYDEVLAAPDAYLIVSGSQTFLTLRRTFRVDSTEAVVIVKANLPEEDILLLRSIGKIEDVLEPSYIRTTSTC